MEPIADAAVGGNRPTGERYRRFAQVEADSSARYRELAAGVANDPELVALIDRLPDRKRQVNLVFAAARVRGAPMTDYRGFRDWMVANWPEVEAVARTHTTQTNEAARCAVLLPLLARIVRMHPGRPLALIEVGASAGLCLQPQRYSYRYGDRERLDPADGPSTVLLECGIDGAVPVPQTMPDIVWSAGIDLNPLDVSSAADLAWLDALIWPEHDDRRARLRAAARIARESPPRIVSGDLNDTLPALAATAPAEATLVVFHTAVLAYLPADARSRFVATVSGLPGHWISNEGVRVTPGVAERLAGSEPRPGEFVLALDGEPVAFAQPHGRWLRWLGGNSGPASGVE